MGRIRHLTSLVARELRQLQAERAAAGVENAVRRRLAHHSGVDRLRAELAATRAELAAVRGRLAAAEEQAAPVAKLAQSLDDHGQAVDSLQLRVRALEPLGSLPATVDDLRVRVEALERAHEVAVFMDWIAQATLAVTPRVTVVLPTRNRAELLPRAVASVQAQRYPEWELIIVDDASDDDTPDVIASFDDERIRSLRVPHGGCCAARNAALDRATGELVAYLDDDNVMHPLWLKSVAWAFGQRPDVDALYGAFVIDDVQRVNRLGSGSLPRLTLHPYLRRHLELGNLADMGAIAHRAGLPHARFDESLVEMGDWDLLCTLTADRDPLVLPAIACYYTTDAPHRLSGGPTYDADYATVRRKHERPVSSS